MTFCFVGDTREWLAACAMACLPVVENPEREGGTARILFEPGVGVVCGLGLGFGFWVWDGR